MKTQPGTLLTLSLLAGYAVILPSPVALAQKDTKEATTTKTETEKSADKPAQSAVALKKPFATIAPTDASLKKALDAKELDKAKKLVDKPSSFKGTVAKVFAPKGNNLVILNFADDYKTALTAVLYKENFAKFPKMSELLNKTVLITGKFSLYKDTAQILLTDPAQVKIVK